MNRIYLFDTVPFDNVNLENLLRQVGASAGQSKPSFLFNMNAFGVVTYLRNDKYRQAMNRAGLIYADGWGPVLASKMSDTPLSHGRLNVGDFVDPLLKIINAAGMKLFLLGTDQTTIASTARMVTKCFPEIKLTGYHHGYFDSVQEERLLSRLNKLQPDVVLVGMGVPKQEIWLDQHRANLPPAVYLGVGGVFHYLACTKKRAPKWMRKLALEWLFRLLQEPHRLGRRYTLDSLVFVWNWLIWFGKKRLFRQLY